MKWWHEAFRDVSIAVAGLVVAIATLQYSIQAAKEERNARLVEIGISVLRVDQTKDPQVNGAREWALDLIDANAGGVKFSAAAREALKQGKFYSEPINSFEPYSYGYSCPDRRPRPPARPARVRGGRQSKGSPESPASSEISKCPDA